jgi:hypothetical protein
MQDDFSKYESLKSSGASAESVYREAINDGVDAITRIRMIRRVFSLSLRDAKEILVRIEYGAKSLEEHQEQFVSEAQKFVAQQSRPTATPR